MLSTSDKSFILENITKDVEWLMDQTGRPKKDIEKFISENKTDNKIAERISKKMLSKKGTAIMTAGASEIIDEIKKSNKKNNQSHIHKIRPEEDTY